MASRPTPYPLPTPTIPAQAIAEAARRLNEVRENWLKPRNLVVRVPEVVPGLPDRLLPRKEAAAILKTRNLRPTSTTSARPSW